MKNAQKQLDKITKRLAKVEVTLSKAIEEVTAIQDDIQNISLCDDETNVA